MKIHVTSDDSLPMSTQTLLKQAVSGGLRLSPRANPRAYRYEVNITLGSPSDVQALNHQYRGIDKVTDVLSFPSSNTAPLPQGRRKKPMIHLGDVIICLGVAQAQANEYGHSLERELAFLTAHGLLHLLDYDHLTPPEEAEMITLQKAIMTHMGLDL